VPAARLLALGRCLVDGRGRRARDSTARRPASAATSSGAGRRGGPARQLADGDGRCRARRAFLGGRGALSSCQRAVRRDKGDSALGGSAAVGQYFTATDPSSRCPGPDAWDPLHSSPGGLEGFKGLHERLAAIEAASRARAEERSRSAAKGGDFEDLLEGILGELARGTGDLLDRTGTEIGAVLGSKKGDFVLTLDPRLTRGADLRVVIEAKDRVMSPRAMRDELREARQNRGAAIGVAVWTPSHAPAGVTPFVMLGEDVHVVVDPEAPDPSYLEAASAGRLWLSRICRPRGRGRRSGGRSALAAI